MIGCRYGAFLALSLALGHLGLLGARPDPEPVAPVVPPIEFPKVVTPPPPFTPAVQPALTPGVIYPVVARVPCVFRAYPASLVAIQPIPVPAGETFHSQAVFVDGTTDHLWKGPCTVYFVTLPEDGKSGTVDLVVTPLGLKSEKEIQTQTVKVENKKQPKPPPPDPTPAPTKLWGVVFVEETAAAVALRGQLLADPTLAKYMKDVGLRFRVVDKDVVGPDGKPPADVKRFLDASAGKVYPQLFLIATDGTIVTSVDASTLSGPTDLINLLKKWNKT